MSLRSRYVSSLRLLRRGLSRVGALTAVERSSNRHIRHLRTLLSIYDTEDLVHLDLPWWTYSAIDYIEDFLRSRPARVFEYGSGASTIWLSQRATTVDSVEHDLAFIRMMSDLTRERANITLHAEPPETTTAPATRSGRKGYEASDFTNYVNSIDRVGGKFDLIVIDGRARVACLTPALGHLNPSGLILFDDVQRARYREVLQRPDLSVEVLSGAKPSLPYPDATAVIRPRAAQSGRQR